MKPLGDTNTHYWLAQRMARITETDLAEAMRRAELTQEDWASMVSACRGCDWTRQCERWLALHQRDTMPEAPADCRNHDKYQRLKDALEALE